MIQHIEDVIFKDSKPICQPLFPSQYLANRIVKLERGTSYFYPAEGLNPSDENSALVHYIQVFIYYLFFLLAGMPITGSIAIDMQLQRHCLFQTCWMYL